MSSIVLGVGDSKPHKAEPWPVSAYPLVRDNKYNGIS